MLPFILYAITAMSTGIQVLVLVAFVVWGRPVSLLECVALFGSMVMIAAAVASFSKATTAIWTGLGGCLLLWSYYGPAIFVNVRNIAVLGCSYPITLYLAPLLLLLTTAHAIAWKIRASSLDWLFPARPFKRKYLAIPVGVVLVAAAPYTGIPSNSLIDPFEPRKLVKKTLTWQRGDEVLGPDFMRVFFHRGPYTCGHEIRKTPAFAQYVESLGRPVLQATYEVFYDPAGQPLTAALLDIEQWIKSRFTRGDASLFGSSNSGSMRIPGDCFDPLASDVNSHLAPNIRINPTGSASRRSPR